jgi:hypothetical protein
MIFIFVEWKLRCKILNKQTLCLVEYFHLERHKVFTIMNYQRIHDAIIDRARSRKLEGYYERHHIIPKCLGGSNDKSNLVELTAREHFIVHKLLYKIYPDNDKLLYAYYAMTRLNINTGKRDYIVSSREYNWLREQHATRMRALYTGRYQAPTRLGQINTPDHNQKIAKSISSLGPRSTETKNKISKSLQGNIPWNYGRIEPREICIACNKDYAIKYKKKHKCFGNNK